MTDEQRNIKGGGGIVRGSQRSVGSESLETAGELLRAFRRRWTTGVAVMSVRDGDRLRGITLTALMPLSIEPPLLAVALAADGAFAQLAGEGRHCAISVLQRDQVFLSERFAGRAPVPDAAFTGIAYELDDHDVPVLKDSAAAVSGVIVSRANHGDHDLVVIEIDGGMIGPDEDDPLVTYEGSYRQLEVE